MSLVNVSRRQRQLVTCTAISAISVQTSDELVCFWWQAQTVGWDRDGMSLLEARAKF